MVRLLPGLKFIFAFAVPLGVIAMLWEGSKMTKSAKAARLGRSTVEACYLSAKDPWI